MLHGLIRDSQGRKMSKSLGNGIDPFAVIDKYGADAMRWALSSSGAPGLDLNIGDKNFQSAQEFINKVWNASRFVLSQLPDGFVPSKVDPKQLGFIDSWLYQKLNAAIKGYSRNMDKYQQGLASKYLYDFLYDDFCGRYLEWTKVDLNGSDPKRKTVIYNVLLDALKAVLVLLFPFCPFVTETVYSYLPGHQDSLFLEPFPEPTFAASPAKAKRGNVLDGVVSFVRQYKADNGLAPNAEVSLTVVGPKADVAQLKPYLVRFSFAKSYAVSKAPVPGMSYFGKLGVFLKAADEQALAKKIAERIAHLKSEIARSEHMLANPNFVARAKKEIVENERKKLAANQAELAKYQTK